jgi:aspartyl protease family protein
MNNQEQEYGHQRFNEYLERSARERRRAGFLLSLLILTGIGALDYHFLYNSKPEETSVTTVVVQTAPPVQAQPDLGTTEPPVTYVTYVPPPLVAPQAAPPQSTRTIELHRQPGGYFIPGSVNGIPVTFQIDTGASYTSIPKDIAYSAGIYGCNGKTFDTANGQVFGCLALANEIWFGPNKIQGFEIVAMPSLKGALLGMNILKFFRIEHEGDVMRITSTVGDVSQASPIYREPIPTQLQIQQPIAPRETIEVRREQYQPTTPSRADIEAGCKVKYDAERNPINERMRHGYTAQEGEYLRDRLRNIEMEYRRCQGN